MSGVRPAVAVYRDLLLPFSETFIRAQAGAMERFEPVFVGKRRVAGIELDPREVEVVEASDDLRDRWDSVQYRLGRAPRKFVSRVASREPVALHAHFGPDALNAAALRRHLRVPLVVTFHGYDATRNVSLSDGLMQWRYGRRRGRLRREATRILAVSDFIRDRLIRLGFPESLVQTHRIGVETARFTPGALADRDRVVLGVGRFVEKKGFRYLVEAMCEVERQVPDARLVVIGDGPLGPELRALARERLSRFEFLGPRPSSEVAEWMRRARVLAVPSVTSATGDTEGLPITIMEALASGLPVAASHHAGIPEAVIDGWTGLLSAERDATALSANIARLLCDDAAWRKCSEAARSHVTEHFDLRTQTRLLEEIYAGVA